MKKLFLTAVAMMVFTVTYAQATKADVEASLKRIVQLKNLVDNQPKFCEVSEIDNFATYVNEAATLAIANSDKLNNLYTRQNDPNAEGGKPAASDWLELGTGVAGEAAKLKSAQEQLETATKRLQSLSDEAKNGNPMAKAKAAKKVKAATSVMSYAKDAISILAVESVEQAKIVKAMTSK